MTNCWQSQFEISIGGAQCRFKQFDSFSCFLSGAAEGLFTAPRDRCSWLPTANLRFARIEAKDRLIDEERWITQY